MPKAGCQHCSQTEQEIQTGLPRASRQMRKESVLCIVVSAPRPLADALTLQVYKMPAKSFSHYNDNHMK